MKTSQFHPIRAHYRGMRIKWGINTYWIWPLLHQRPKIWTKNREIHSLEWYHWNCPLSGQLCLAGYTQSSVPGELKFLISISKSMSYNDDVINSPFKKTFQIWKNIFSQNGLIFSKFWWWILFNMMNISGVPSFDSPKYYSKVRKNTID